MNQQNQPRQISIKEAVVDLENLRHSTVISYIAAQNALIGQEDAGLLVDSIERVLPESGKFDKLDLFIHSPGGFLDSAFKLVRICKEYSREFNVIVPLAAKSAATAICLGAKQIVMTSISELGPLDPIIQHPYKPEIRVPARAIKDFFSFLSSTETDKIPVDPSVKAQMSNLLDPYLIGSYQTALESSKQIAEMLLQDTPLKSSPEKLHNAVFKLTEGFRSHSFVIDRNMARELGLNVINAEEDKSLIAAIRVLFNVYQQFMMANHIIKLIGNREENRSMQPMIQPVTQPNPSTAINLKF